MARRTRTSRTVTAVLVALAVMGAIAWWVTGQSADTTSIVGPPPSSNRDALEGVPVTNLTPEQLTVLADGIPEREVLRTERTIRMVASDYALAEIDADVYAKAMPDSLIHSYSEVEELQVFRLERRGESARPGRSPLLEDDVEYMILLRLSGGRVLVEFE